MAGACQALSSRGVQQKRRKSSMAILSKGGENLQSRTVLGDPTNFKLKCVRVEKLNGL